MRRSIWAPRAQGYDHLDCDRGADDHEVRGHEDGDQADDDHGAAATTWPTNDGMGYSLVVFDHRVGYDRAGLRPTRYDRATWTDHVFDQSRSTTRYSPAGSIAERRQVCTTERAHCGRKGRGGEGSESLMASVFDLLQAHNGSTTEHHHGAPPRSTASVEHRQRGEPLLSPGKDGLGVL